VVSAVAALNKLRALQAADLGVTAYSLASIEPANTYQMAAMNEPLHYFLGSMIGTSKMLHFLDPEVFPIWDAVIHWFTRESKTSAADSLRSYAYYTLVVHHLIKHADFEARIYQSLLEAMGQAQKAISGQYRMPEPMSKVRATEFIKFFGIAEPVAP
jgi:hypothetical protein